MAVGDAVRAIPVHLCILSRDAQCRDRARYGPSSLVDAGGFNFLVGMGQRPTSILNVYAGISRSLAGVGVYRLLDMQCTIVQPGRFLSQVVGLSLPLHSSRKVFDNFFGRACLVERLLTNFQPVRKGCCVANRRIGSSVSARSPAVTKGDIHISTVSIFFVGLPRRVRTRDGVLSKTFQS